TAARYSEKSTMMRSSASPKPNTKARSSPLPGSLGRIVSTGASELASTSGTAEQNAGNRHVARGSVKLLDRLLQRWRIAKAAPYVARGARVLDVGCADGALFRIVHALARVGLVAGMALHEHHGYAAQETPGRFADAGFSLERHERFQLGLNNLYVFRASG